MIDTPASCGGSFEEPHRLRPVAGLIGSQTRLVTADPFRRLGACTLGHAQELVDGEAPGPTVDGYPIEPADDDSIAGGDARVCADNDVDAVDFSQRFEAAGDVYRMPATFS